MPSRARTIPGMRRVSDTTHFLQCLKLLEGCAHSHSERIRVLQSPRIQLLQQITKRAALLGKGVGVHTTAARLLSRHQARSGQVSQSFAQNLVAEARDKSSQFRIAARSLFQIGEYHRLPLSPEHGERELGGAVEVSRQSFTHDSSPHLANGAVDSCRGSNWAHIAKRSSIRRQRDCKPPTSTCFPIGALRCRDTGRKLALQENGCGGGE